MRPRKKVSSSGIELIESFEGLRPRAARLPDGRWTIGYGHTQSAREGLEVTADDARLLLQWDLRPVEAMVDVLVQEPLNQNQYDALVAFAFNVGLEAFRDSEVLKCVNEGRFVEAACALDLWRKAEVIGGDPLVLDALIRRRAAEKKLFLTPPEGWAPSPTALVRPTVDPVAEAGLPRERPAEIEAPMVGDTAEVWVRGQGPESATPLAASEPSPDPVVASALDGVLPATFEDAAPAESALYAGEILEIAPVAEPEPAVLTATARAAEPEAQASPGFANRPDPWAFEPEAVAAPVMAGALAPKLEPWAFDLPPAPTTEPEPRSESPFGTPTPVVEARETPGPEVQPVLETQASAPIELVPAVSLAPVSPGDETPPDADLVAGEALAPQAWSSPGLSGGPGAPPQSYGGRQPDMPGNDDEKEGEAPTPSQRTHEAAAVLSAPAEHVSADEGPAADTDTTPADAQRASEPPIDAAAEALPAPSRALAEAAETPQKIFANYGPMAFAVMPRKPRATEASAEISGDEAHPPAREPAPPPEPPVRVAASPPDRTIASRSNFGPMFVPPPAGRTAAVPGPPTRPPQPSPIVAPVAAPMSASESPQARPLVLTSPPSDWDEPRPGVVASTVTMDLDELEAPLFDQGWDASTALTTRIVRHEAFDPTAPRHHRLGVTGPFLLLGLIGLVAFGGALFAYWRGHAAGASTGGDPLVLASALMLIGVVCVAISVYFLLKRLGGAED